MKVFRFILVFVVLLLALPNAYGQETPIKVTVDGRGDAFFHHPVSQEKLHLVYPGQEQLKQASPKNIVSSLGQRSLETAKMMKRLGQASVNNPIVKPAVETFVNFPMHAIPFYSAMFSIAVVQVHLGSGSDPMAIARFWESMADMPGHIGFAAFIYTNHQFTAVMNAMFKDNTFKNYIKTYRQVKATTDPRLKRKLMGQLRSKQKVIKAHWEPLRSRVAKPVLFASQYMGMALGSLASGIVTDFISDANVRVCSGHIFNMSETPECEVAFDKWTSHDHWWNFAPHATSVVAAAFASLSTHKIATVTTQAVFGLSIKGLSRLSPRIGLLSLRFNQIGWAVNMGYMFVNAANFLVWSHYLEYPARRFHFQTFVANNTTGPALSQFETSIDYLKKAKWSEENIQGAMEGSYSPQYQTESSPYDIMTTFQKPLLEIFDHYRKQTLRYREQNIMYKAESTFVQWQDYLLNYETIRDFSELFYRSYVKQILLSNKEPRNLSHYLNKTFPLYGIASMPLFSNEYFLIDRQEEKENFQFIDRIADNNPQELAEYLIYEHGQKKTVHASADILYSQASLINLNSSVESLKYTQDIMNQVFRCSELLKNSNPEVMGEGIILFYDLFATITNSNRDRPITAHSREVVNQLIPLFDDLHTLWSASNKDQPYPRTAEEALMISVEDIVASNMILDIYGEGNPQINTATAELKKNHVKNHSNIPIRSIGEALLVSMVCGPDPEINESVISAPRGWRAQFLPPKIVSGDTRMLCRQNPLEGQLRGGTVFDEVTNNIHHWDFDFNGKTYKGLGSLIVDNIKVSVRGEKTDIYSGLEAGWWKNNVWDTDNEARFAFQEQYEKQIREVLLPTIVESSYSYKGKIANGLANSMADELRQWAKVVDGIYKKAMSDQGQQAKVEANKMSTVLQDAEKDIQNLLLSLTDFARNGELTNEFYTLAQKSLIALNSTVDESPRLSYVNFYPLFTQLLSEIPANSGLTEATNLQLDKMYTELDQFLDGNVDEKDLNFESLNQRYKKYNLLLLKSYEEQKDTSMVGTLQERLKNSSQLIKLKKILPNLGEKQKEIYILAIQNIINLVNESYLKYQLVYNFYSQIPNLNGEDMAVDKNRRSGARHN